MQHRYRLAALAAAVLAVSAGALYAITSPAVAAQETPQTPTGLRIQTDPYQPNQLCRAGTAVVSKNDTIVLAASPVPLGRHPGLRGTFEVAGGEGTTPISSTRPIWPSGRVFALTIDPGTLSAGAYRWRVRAEQGKEVSGWTPWCGLTVKD
ncbi:hypothetical protein ABZ860_26555 [Microbispora sp. NPDC046973]|uniref:hypothetical protein n=1 Tax=Microbispora sp. NPDC046973 TaxID=3155022 RepID=UPI0033F84239